jgi:RND family efflux transporter MFP subunit
MEGMGELTKELEVMSQRKKRFLHLVVIIILLALGGLGMYALTTHKSEVERRRPPVSVPVVRTIRVTVGSQPVVVQGEGTVQPLQEIRIAPEVGGKVVYVSPNMVNGGAFSKGETLLRVDPADYELAATLARASVKDAESKLQLAEEETAASIQEWRLYGEGGTDTTKNPPPLVAKEPQLAAAQAKLDAEKADLKKALLNLERTEIKAPFDGRVSQENMDIGEYVTPGQDIATIYSTEAAEIIIPLEDRDLFWIHVPGFTPGNGPGAPVTVRASIAGRQLSWSGKVVRAEGRLDERTRMINVVVRVERPYATKPPLPVGFFVTAGIMGRTLSDVAVVPRAALHQDNVIWVVEKDGRLRFRKVEVARIEGEKVFVSAGLNNGEVLVITPLKAVSDGMSVRVVAADGDDLS